jgi:signal transduction histidine kinase
LVFIILILICITVIALLIIKIIRLKYQVRKLQIALDKECGKKELNELENHLINFIEDELQRIGADVHDDLVQRVSEQLLLIERIANVEDVDLAQTYGFQLKKHTQVLVASLRTLSHNLLPGSIDSSSLLIALNNLIAGMGKSSPYNAHINVGSEGLAFQLQSNHQAHIVRIVQELIHNALKNGLAWHVIVTLFWKENFLEIKIEDDGIRSSILLPQAKFSGAFRTLKMRNNYLRSSLVFELREERGVIITIKYPDIENPGKIKFI